MRLPCCDCYIAAAIVAKTPTSVLLILCGLILVKENAAGALLLVPLLLVPLLLTEVSILVAKLILLLMVPVAECVRILRLVLAVRVVLIVPT